MSERDELEMAITLLEAQRNTLGGAAVDAALTGINHRLAELNGAEVAPYMGVTSPKISSERRVVTILFCDVAGSTSLAEGMDPEAWTEIMNAAYEVLIASVERFGGKVANLMGDAILAFFGAPLAHEDDPQRSILAGLAIVENIIPLRDKLKRQRGIDFNVRVGINTGLAIVGEVGSESAGDYTAMGDAVNVAARMEQTAEPGTVQVSNDTYTLVAPLFEFKPLGAISVKGKNKPIPSYQAVGLKAGIKQMRGLGNLGISSSLVGRESEFAAAQAAFTRLEAGEGGILAIIGEAGIGKTRLLSELRDTQNQAQKSDAPIRWLEGQTMTFGQSISYFPFQQIFRHFAGINDDDSEITAFRKLEAGIQNLFPVDIAAEECGDILPYIASMLALKIPGEYSQKVAYLDGEALGSQVYRACWRFFNRLAEERPLVLVIDDLHWIDASSTGLLEHLFPLANRVPILFCGLSRPDPESPAARLLKTAGDQFAPRQPGAMTVVELAPLSPDDSRHLVENLLQIDGLPEQTRKMILTKADGNPFYLEEIIRVLVESGVLVRDPATAQWQATRHIAEVQVPDTIQGLLIARIDRLDANLKQVIRRAAVIGRVFLYRILNAILEGDRDLEQELQNLQNIELIREFQRLPELEYIFKHALAQEAAYAGILLEERREVHGRVGLAIERLMADRLEEFYGVLAFHFSTAEQWEKAQEYLFKAGDQAGRMAADAEALTLYRQAMEAYTRVRGDDWDLLERARLERKIGEALFRLGDFDQAHTYLEKTITLLGEDLPSSRWGVRLAIVRALLAQATHRLFPKRFVKPMNGSPDPVAEELFNAGNALGWIEGVANVERYFLLTVRILNASEQRGYANGCAHLAAGVSTAFELMGWKNLVEPYANLASEYARHIVPTRPVFLLEWSRAFHHNANANWTASLQHAQRAIEIARSTGDFRSWGSGMDLSSWAYQSMGMLTEARDTCLEMIAVAEEGSDLQTLCWAFMGLGVTRKRLGLMDEAINDLKKAIEIAENVPDYHTQVAASGWLGRCYVARSELEQALAVLDASYEVLSKSGVVIEMAILGNGFSEAYLAAAERSTGKERQEWLKKAQRSCKGSLKAARRYRPPLQDAMLFQGRYEWLRGDASGARKWWGKALEEARYKGDRYEEGVVHLEIGTRLDDCSHLEQAEAIFEEIGAEFDLALAKKAIKLVKPVRVG